MTFHTHNPPPVADEAAHLRALLAQPGTRRLLSDKADLCIRLLDLLDADPDLEPDGGEELTANESAGQGFSTIGDDDAEPDLGWSGTSQLRLTGHDDGDNTAPETHGRGFRRAALDDMEPSLAAGDAFDQRSQEWWAAGPTDDREDDLDLHEGDGSFGRSTVDDEVSLGWQNVGSQERLHASTDDREHDADSEEGDQDGGPSDNGLGDDGGAAEQFAGFWDGQGRVIEADGTPDDFSTGGFSHVWSRSRRALRPSAARQVLR